MERPQAQLRRRRISTERPTSLADREQDRGARYARVARMRFDRFRRRPAHPSEWHTYRHQAVEAGPSQHPPGASTAEYRRRRSRIRAETTSDKPSGSAAGLQAKVGFPVMDSIISSAGLNRYDLSVDITLVYISTRFSLLFQAISPPHAPLTTCVYDTEKKTGRVLIQQQR